MENLNKNIMFVFLEDIINRKKLSFYSTYHNKETKFCFGFSLAEPSVKFALATEKIDQIIVIGQKNAVEKIDENNNLYIPSEHKEIDLCDIPKYDYDFFCKCISIFMNESHAEEIKFLEECKKNFQDLSKKDNNMLNKIISLNEQYIKDYKKDFASGLKDTAMNELFYELATNEEKEKEFNDYFGLHDSSICKIQLYQNLKNSYKLYASSLNKDLKITFGQLVRDDNGEISLGKISENFLKMFNKYPNSNYNIYTHVLGLNANDKNLIAKILEVFNNSNLNINFKADYQISSYKGAFTHKIINSISSLNSWKAVSAISDFIKFGKISPIIEISELYGLNNNKNLQNTINALKFIDTGISLCNLDTLLYGIDSLRKILDKDFEEGLEGNALSVAKLLRNAIESDYKELLKDEEVSIYSLTDWALKKCFYQQALTLIESLAPGEMVKKGVFFYAKYKEEADKLKEKVNVYYWNEISKNRYQFDDFDHYYIKNYGRDLLDGHQSKDKRAKETAKLHVEQLKDPNHELGPAYSYVNNNDLLYELLLAYYNVGNLRNSVAHAEKVEEHSTADINGVPEDDTFIRITNEVKKFLNLYNSCLKKAKANFDTEPVLITNFKSYAKKHKLVELTPANNTGIIDENAYVCEFNGQEIKVAIRLRKMDDFYGD